MRARAVHLLAPVEWLSTKEKREAALFKACVQGRLTLKETRRRLAEDARELKRGLA